jgi:hypothetical protein
MPQYTPTHHNKGKKCPHNIKYMRDANKMGSLRRASSLFKAAVRFKSLKKKKDL